MKFLYALLLLASARAMAMSNEMFANCLYDQNSLVQVHYLTLKDELTTLSVKSDPVSVKKVADVTEEIKKLYAESVITCDDADLVLKSALAIVYQANP